MANPVRVLLADDQATLRAALAAIIDHQPDMQIVGVVADGHAAVEAARSLQPDVLVTDLSMPVLDGVQATMQIRADGLPTRVVAWTARPDPSSVAAVQRAGGDGYVLKHSPVEVLLDAIRAVASGSRFCDPTLASPSPPELPDASTAPDLSPDLLSPEELQVLQQTARGSTSQEIAQLLGVPLPVVADVRRRAMARLGLGSRVALVCYAARQGWLGDLRG